MFELYILLALQAGQTAFDPQLFITHAGAIAGLIATLVAALKSPFARLFWQRVPIGVRLLALALLAAAGAFFEALVIGKPPAEAIIIAATGLFGAVGAREMFRSVKPAKKKQPPTLVR
jgi:hypothetical protein